MQAGLNSVKPNTIGFCFSVVHSTSYFALPARYLVRSPPLDFALRDTMWMPDSLP